MSLRLQPPGLLTPIKVRPDVSPSLAAALAYEPRFQIGEPDVIRPWVSADRDRMAALVVRAIDQEPRTPDERISPDVIFSERSFGLSKRDHGR